MPFFEHDGAELHFETSGIGEPLLFLHGLGSSLLDWELQVAAFQDRYRTIAVSMRGSGESADRRHPDGPFRVEQFARDVAALIEHLGVGPVHLCGLSMGGAVAFQLAATRPDLIRSMTIVNSAPAFIVRGFRANFYILLRRVVARLKGPQGMAAMLAPKLFPDPAHANLREQFIARMGKNRRGAYISSQLATLNWSVLDRLPTMPMPTCVIGAEFDYPFLANKLAWVAKMPNASYVEIAGTHHALPIEAPEAFNQALGAFLARQTGH